MSTRAPDRPTTARADGDRHGPVSPAGTRAARPRWLDPRLLVGAGLVLASVLFGARVVAGADDTVPVWAARTALAPGQAVTAAALEVRQVRLDDASAYVGAGPGATTPAGWVAVRAVGPGELLPRAAVRERGAVDVRYVTVALPREELPYALGPGSRVEVWTAPTGSDGATGPAARPSTGGADAAAPPATAPRRLLGATAVQEVVVADATFGGATTTVPVVLALPADQTQPSADRSSDAVVGEVLDAARAGRLYLVGLPAAG